MKAAGFIRESDKTCGKMSHVRAKWQCLTITHMAMFNENQTVTGQYKYHTVMTENWAQNSTNWRTTWVKAAQNNHTN